LSLEISAVFFNHNELVCVRVCACVSYLMRFPALMQDRQS